MSAADDFADGVQALAARVKDAADDPADQVRLLQNLASFFPNNAMGTSPIGVALGQAQRAVGDLCRRAALVALARASAEYQPTSYDDATGIRDIVCGLLEAEEIVAGDQGQDASYAALRDLRMAVAADLTARGASLAPLATVAPKTALPALALAYRLYGDATRADELMGYAGQPCPLFVSGPFRAPAI